VKPNNTAALFAIMAINGASSIAMLPVGLELACELTRNSDGSSAIAWFSCVGLQLIDIPTSHRFLTGETFLQLFSYYVCFGCLTGPYIDVD
jgi:hypothetical protein